MYTLASKKQEQSGESLNSEKGYSSKVAFKFADHRPGALAMCALQELANNSPQTMQLMALQKIAKSSPQAARDLRLQESENSHSEHPVQKKENNHGLPDKLKSGIESLSGYPMDDVTVHYHSDKPAQVQAHAFARGTAIHLAPGQEKHLPHEAWHIVQQKEGSVKPTRQIDGVPVNDDARLEREADRMGARAMQMQSNKQIDGALQFNSVQGNGTVQRVTRKDRFNVIGENHGKKYNYKDFFLRKHALPVQQVYNESAFFSAQSGEYGDPKDLRLEFLLGSFIEEISKLTAADTEQEFSFDLYAEIFYILEKLEAEINGKIVDQMISKFVVASRKYLNGISRKSQSERSLELWGIGNEAFLLDITPRNTTTVRKERSRQMHRVAQQSRNDMYSVWLIGDYHVKDIMDEGLVPHYALTSKEEFEMELAELKTRKPLLAHEISISNLSCDELGGKYDYEVRSRKDQKPEDQGSLKSGGTFKGSADCEIRIPGITGDSWIKVDYDASICVRGGYVLQFAPGVVWQTAF